MGETGTYQYTYDTSGRLVHVYKNSALISTYTYDSNGNRLSHTSPTGTDTGVYDNQDRMLSYGNTSFGYNARGSLTFREENGDTTWYNYDMLGNLLSVNMPNGDLIEYLIDAQNRRIGKKLNGVLQRQWIYQDQLNPVAELDGNGNLISRFVYGDKGHVPAYMIRGSVTYRYVTDHLGSVRLLVNASTGEVVQQLSYNEFGEVLYNTNPDFQPFAYAGGLYDTQIQLVRFGARDYDAEVGRWTAKDPIGFGGGSNIYAFCINEPINHFDLTGWQSIQTSNYEFAMVFGYVANRFVHYHKLTNAANEYMYRYDLSHLAIDKNGNMAFDKYYHCMANCESAKMGKIGEGLTENFSDLNEWNDKSNFQDTDLEIDLKCAQDQAANEFGRKCPKDTPCSDWCKSQYYAPIIPLMELMSQ